MSITKFVKPELLQAFKTEMKFALCIGSGAEAKIRVEQVLDEYLILPEKEKFLLKKKLLCETPVNELVGMLE
jgi:hypothetical protein